MISEPASVRVNADGWWQEASKEGWWVGDVNV